MLSPPVLFLCLQYNIYPVIIQCQHGYNLPDIVFLPYTATETAQSVNLCPRPVMPSMRDEKGVDKVPATGYTKFYRSCRKRRKSL